LSTGGVITKPNASEGNAKRLQSPEKKKNTQAIIYLGRIVPSFKNDEAPPKLYTRRGKISPFLEF